MVAAILTRDGKGRFSDGATCYRIPGYPHLRVEPLYDDPPDACDGLTTKASLYGWAVVDEQFDLCLDRYRRGLVIVEPTLTAIRDWVRQGGPEIWDPEQRLTDVRWKPSPKADPV